MARIAIVGVGAVGATLAAAVQDTGHELMLCDLRDRGRLVVHFPGQPPALVGTPVHTDPDTVHEATDWVFLSVKAHQTPGTERWLRRLCGPRTVVVVLQNGVEHRARVTQLVGDAAVLPAVVWFAARIVAPGEVHVRGKARLVAPENAEGDALRALLGGGLSQVDLVADFRAVAWEKLCFNAVAGLQALAGRPAGIFAVGEMQTLGRRLATECVSVARAEGVVLPSDVVERVMARLAASPPDAPTSILVDRLAGRPMEWDARNGVIRRLGKRHGIATPVSDVIVPLLMAADGAPGTSGARCGCPRP